MNLLGLQKQKPMRSLPTLLGPPSLAAKPPGAPKKLLKGERYIAAATLMEVDLEEQWSWSGSTTKFLDATCLVYDSRHTYVGRLDYLSTALTAVSGKAIPQGVLKHSGDVMDNAKRTGLHQIHVEVGALPSEIHLYITVSSFQGAKLKEIREPSVRLMDSTGHELCRYDVQGADGNKTAILMCVLHRHRESSTTQMPNWTLEAIGEVGGGSADNYDPIFATVEKFRKGKKW